MTWVIAYDVSRDRHRNRVSRCLAAKGIRIQKSVFLVEGTRQQAQALVRALSAEVDAATDSICAWPLSESWQAQQHVYPAESAPLQQIYVVA